MTTTDMKAALQACVDAMLHDGVPTDPDHPRRVALAAAENALACQSQGVPVAWQVRRADGRIDGVPIQWENCTKELYEATLSTGRYAGYENGPRCEVRALTLDGAAINADLVEALEAAIDTIKGCMCADNSCEPALDLSDLERALARAKEQK